MVELIKLVGFGTPAAEVVDVPGPVVSEELANPLLGLPKYF